MDEAAKSWSGAGSKATAWRRATAGEELGAAARKREAVGWSRERKRGKAAHGGAEQWRMEAPWRWRSGRRAGSNRRAAGGVDGGAAGGGSGEGKGAGRQSTAAVRARWEGDVTG